MNHLESSVITFWGQLLDFDFDVDGGFRFYFLCHCDILCIMFTSTISCIYEALKENPEKIALIGIVSISNNAANLF